MTHEKPVQPDPLAAPPKPGIPHVSEVRSASPGICPGPMQIDAGKIGVYVEHGSMAELKALLQYAAQRLDSGKVSPELRASEPIVRRVLRWIEIADGENVRRSNEYVKARSGPLLREAKLPGET